MHTLKIRKKIFQIIFLFFTIIWMSIIFYFSNQPSSISLDASGDLLVKMNQLNESDIHNINNRTIWTLHYYIRKFAHFIIYFGLGGLILFAFSPKNCQPIQKSLLTPWLLASLYGIFDELHQNFIPGRGATLSDVKLDSASAFLGVLIGYLIFKWLQRFITFY